MGFLDKNQGGYIGESVVPNSMAASGVWSLNSVIVESLNKSWALSIVKDSLALFLEAPDKTSYPSSGTTWYDLSGNNRHATLYNGTVKVGDNFEFDGSTKYAAGTIPTTSTTSMSVCLVVNITGGTNSGCFFKLGSNAAGIALGIGSGTMEGVGTNIIGLFPAIRWIPTTTSLGSGLKMVSMTVSSSGVPSIYLNGALVGTYPGTNMSAPSGTYNLGRCIGDEGTGRQYQGGISSVLFYNKELTLAEIQQNYLAFQGRYII